MMNGDGWSRLDPTYVTWFDTESPCRGGANHYCGNQGRLLDFKKEGERKNIYNRGK